MIWYRSLITYSENSSEEEDGGAIGDGGAGEDYSDEDLEELALGKRDDESQESEEETFTNPYPLENKYKDEADRAQ